MNNNNKWYSDGLEFECQQCGQCCTGAPGYVWLEDTDYKNMSEHLEITIEEFTRKFVRKTSKGGYSLIEKENYDCIFFDKSKGCTVYEARPIQCKTYPFWPENMINKNEWNRLKRLCPGVNQKNLISFIEIEEKLSLATPELKEK